jgi:hypothetical protein
MYYVRRETRSVRKEKGWVKGDKGWERRDEEREKSVILSTLSDPSTILKTNVRRYQSSNHKP